MNMTRNIIGSIIFAIAVLFLIDFIGDALLAPGADAPRPASHEKLAPEPEQPTTEAPAAAPAVVAMSAEAAAGAKLFRKKCKSCHTEGKGEPNRTGPNLWDIVDRPKASADGYKFSDSLRMVGGTWTLKDLNSFIAGPRSFASNTKMTFKGIKKPEQRAAIVAFLAILKD